jgi:hypothetical protein
MTSSFDDRQKAFENKFKVDEELRFKVHARAVKLFGHWAAQKMGMSGADEDAYVDAVVDADFDEPGINDVLRKVKKDFDAKGVEMTEHHLNNEFNLCMNKAKNEMAG